MTEVIRGKVARILNSREVAINVGSEQGVVIGMLFDIVDEHEEVRDPDTNQVLGSIDRPKVRVKVTHVQDKLALASTFKSRSVNVGGQGVGLELGAFTRAFAPPKWKTEYETLRTEEKTWEDLDEAQSYVKTGDPVVQVFEETEESLPAA